MQPTNRQVERSLAALLADDGADAALVDGASPDATVAPRADRREVPDGVLEAIQALPAVRTDRLDDARSLVDAGSYPDADLLAQKMVGRIVCDRLR